MSSRRQQPVEILHEDDEIVVVSKPAGVPVVPTRSGDAVSLREILAEALGGKPPFVVHRIDMETSGVVVFARTREAHRALSLSFQDRKVEKVYLAIVAGRPDPPDGTVDLPLAHDRRDSSRMVVAKKKGKNALTRYHTIETFVGFALVEARPVTGRLHQVRVHLKSVGAPLAVDPVYGAGEGLLLSSLKKDYRPKAEREERPLIGRLTLHAFSIAFEHPAEGRRIEVEADPPKDFQVALKQLRKYASVIPPQGDQHAGSSRVR